MKQSFVTLMLILLVLLSQTALRAQSSTQAGDAAFNSIILNSDPTQPFQAATKHYVDNQSGAVIVVTAPPINAKCDGHSDDSAALQAALNMSQAPFYVITLVIPDSDQCNFASTLYPPNDSYIFLTTPGTAYLDYTGTGNAFEFRNLGGDYQFIANNMWFEIGTSSTTATPTYFKADSGSGAFLYLTRDLLESDGSNPSLPYFTAVNMAGAGGAFTWIAGDTFGQILLNGTDGFLLRDVNILAYDTCLPIGIQIQNVTQAGNQGTDWNVGNNALEDVTVSSNGGTCAGSSYPGWGIDLENNVGNFNFNHIQFVSGGTLGQALHIGGTQAALSGWLDFSQVTTTWNTAPSAISLSVATSTRNFVIGPLTAPSGTCPATQGGGMVWSQDGHATYCPTGGGTWTTKF